VFLLQFLNGTLDILDLVQQFLNVTLDILDLVPRLLYEQNPIFVSLLLEFFDLLESLVPLIVENLYGAFELVGLLVVLTLDLHDLVYGLIVLIPVNQLVCFFIVVDHA
jgi:hypothetical protein